METPTVEFRPVKDFENRYLIGSDGKLRSVVFGKERDRKFVVGKDGYVRVSLTDGTGKAYTRYLHRLVAEAFLDNSGGWSDVNHKDMDKQNNCVTNLEWVTRGDNLRKARAVLGNWGVEAAKRLRKPVIARSVTTGEKVEFASARTWALEQGNKNKCANVCTAIKTGRPAYGFYWRHKE
jgi:hypothetical protein